MTNSAPISVCLIVKNEQNTIEQCLKSIRDYVSEICVVDTGSTDSTFDIVKKYADKCEVYTGCNDKNGLITSFSDARNKSYSLATQPWSMWIDGDDEVRNAEKLYDLIKKYENETRPVSIMLPYEYAHDSNGNVICIHKRERITTTGKFSWHGPVHEVLLSNESSFVQHQYEDVVVVHHRDTSGKIIEKNRNLRILKMDYEKNGEHDARQLYYLGMEYGNSGDINNSIKFFSRYTELSKWDDEKYLACLNIATHYQNKGDLDKAVEWALKATTIYEKWGEAYFSLGRSYYFMAQRGNEQRNWERSVHYFKYGLECPPTKTTLFINPTERSFEIHKFLNFALNKIGDVSGALQSVETALKTKYDESLLFNSKVYKRHLHTNDIQKSLNGLISLGDITEETKNNVLNIIALNNTNAVKISNEICNKIEDLKEFRKKLDIIIYVGPGIEPWNPDTVNNTGIGGSETAVIMMSKLLVKNYGHRVRVYGDCTGLEGVFDGVEYISHSKFRNLECDVFITSRRPHVVDDEYNIKSKVVFCWVHDVHCGQALTHSRALRIDKFLCLSPWHRNFFLSTYNYVHQNQVICTRNGIDISLFDAKDVQRNPFRAIYSSSPDRGLEVAISVWPNVRKVIPYAELHIYYGFETWEVSARYNNDQGQLALINKIKNMLLEYRKYGVFYHGRINKKQLAKEFLGSGVLAYPTWFSETSCQTAMEAQAAGLKIVTSDIAALSTTVGSRGILLTGDWLSNSYQSAFTDAVIQEMNKGSDEPARKLLQDYARDNFSWETLSHDWNDMFYSVIKEVEYNIVPPYKSSY